ncbi:hypothetical protein BpHYR1_007351 [Brachionus plicatilis]|uniref:Uncharacterized protein n=1 Tax=Brachionus plicatilis TaxID=10195 RepID=A0A3M7PBZ9_BRAPC|nr:hypothetical protein BpHYR1_007351 [Brachionus plicatilis]
MTTRFEIQVVGPMVEFTRSSMSSSTCFWSSLDTASCKWMATGRSFCLTGLMLGSMSSLTSAPFMQPILSENSCGNNALYFSCCWLWSPLKSLAVSLLHT